MRTAAYALKECYAHAAPKGAGAAATHPERLCEELGPAFRPLHTITGSPVGPSGRLPIWRAGQSGVGLCLVPNLRSLTNRTGKIHPSTAFRNRELCTRRATGGPALVIGDPSPDWAGCPSWTAINAGRPYAINNRLIETWL
jgi:hypothetical protein